MKNKTMALTAAGIGTAFVAAALTLVDTAPEYELQSAGQFQHCVTTAVRQHYPDAKGGLILAENRAPSYREYGDILHFRERGLRTVNSVTVVFDTKATGGPDVWAVTRKGPVVLPSSILPAGVINALESRHMSYSKDTGVDTWEKTADEKAIEATQKSVIRQIEACRF